MVTQVKSEEEINAMRHGGKILSATLQQLQKEIKPGITTDRLNQLADNFIRDHGGLPTFLNYKGFPASLCVSVNDEIVHGIPGSRVIKDGDVVGLDLGVTYHEMITDAAVTVAVGETADLAKKLLNATKKALEVAINSLKNGIRIGDLGAAIEEIIEKNGFCVVEPLCGHGVGHQLHEDPSILNYGTKGTGQVLKSGMTVAIEPIASVSSSDMKIADDGWTCLTTDGSLAAQFEHTALITDDGAEILTV